MLWYRRFHPDDGVAGGSVGRPDTANHDRKSRALTFCDILVTQEDGSDGGRADDVDGLRVAGCEKFDVFVENGYSQS